MPKPHKKKGEKRISFSTHQISHLYEMAYEHLMNEFGCFECSVLIGRIEKFLGQKEVQRIGNAVNKNSYCDSSK